MINSFHVKNFKSLKQVDVPMGRLNLFMGMNGMGKSSVIQSLLLLRQSFENQPVFLGILNKWWKAHDHPACIMQFPPVI